MIRLALALGLLVSLAVLSLATSALAADGTASVHGVLTENAVVKEPIVNASVTVGGIAATVTGASYAASGVPVGPQRVLVRAPGHPAYTGTVMVIPGDNTFNVRLLLTVRETYLRYYKEYNHARFYTAWKMVHPDVRGHLIQWGHVLTYQRYVAYMRTWKLPFVSMRIVSIGTQATWRPRPAAHLVHTTYYNLQKIVRVIRYRYDQVYTDRCYNRWQRISGRWYIIFDAAWYCR